MAGLVPGLVPAIHVVQHPANPKLGAPPDADDRDKPGDDRYRHFHVLSVADGRGRWCGKGKTRCSRDPRYVAIPGRADNLAFTGESR
jgi:hypothetical protein